MNTTATILPSSPRFFGFTALLLASLFLLSSCQAEIKSVEPTLNPNPKEIYEITVTVENAPVEFTSAEAVVVYTVKPRECLPPAPPFSMTDSAPVVGRKENKLNIRRLSSNVLVSRVIFDAYTPQNDYGLGFCKWGPQYAAVSLYNGINKLDISISSSELREEADIKEATIIDWFTKAETTELVKTARKVNKDNSHQYSPDAYFYISLRAKKVSS